MTATATQKRWHRQQQESGNAPGIEERMARQARHGLRVERAAMRRELDPPRHSKKGVARDGELVPHLPPDFVNEATRRMQIHLAAGNWEAARRTLEAIERDWQVRKAADEVAGCAACSLDTHVTCILPQRIANAVESVCAGTIGSLLECFPAAFVNKPNIGQTTVEKIGQALVKCKALTAQDAAVRVEQYINATMTR